MNIFQHIFQIAENVASNGLVKILLLIISIVMMLFNYLEGQEDSVIFIYNNF